MQKNIRLNLFFIVLFATLSTFKIQASLGEFFNAISSASVEALEADIRNKQFQLRELKKAIYTTQLEAIKTKSLTPELFCEKIKLNFLMLSKEEKALVITISCLTLYASYKILQNLFSSKKDRSKNDDKDDN